MVESVRDSTASLSETEDLDRVYREQAPRMWRTLTAHAGSREIAEDAVAEAFAQALAWGDEIRSPERWVWKAAYRIAAGELQRRGTLTSLSVDEPVMNDEPASEIRETLARLAPKQRASIVLHYYAGYPALDIARIIGSTPAAVWVHLSRGRRQMRRMLEEADD